jgi:WD40 repeat protein
MFRLPRFCRRLAIFGLWIGGVLVIWSLLPVAPHGGWQPPADEAVIGFFDSRTLATTPTWTGQEAPAARSVRLWDFKLGKLLATYDFNGRTAAWPVGDGSLLQLTEREGNDGDASHTYHFRLLDANTGEERAHFKTFVPNDYAWWWISPDQRMTAFPTFEASQHQVEIRELPSGRLLQTLPGQWLPIFSSNGQRFAVADKVGQDAAGSYEYTITTWDLNSGRKLSTVKTGLGLQGLTRFYTGTVKEFPEVRPYQPKAFSPDGELLLDSQGQVWDVATGKIKFAPPWSTSAHFTPAGTEVVAMTRLPPSWELCLAYYDLKSGQELAGRRVYLPLGQAFLDWRAATPDGRLMLANGSPPEARITEVMTFLNRLIGRGAQGQPRMPDTVFVIETETGRIVAQAPGQAVGCSPDGRFLVTRTQDNRYQLWDVPARKSVFWVWTLSIAWSLALAFVGHLSARRARLDTALVANANADANHASGGTL